MFNLRKNLFAIIQEQNSLQSFPLCHHARQIRYLYLLNLFFVNLNHVKTRTR